MKILITGAGGFIGSHLARSFAHDGYDVVATYRKRPPKMDYGVVDRTELIQVDLSQSSDALCPVDVVVHAAGHSHVIPGSTPQDFFESNVLTTLNLANYAAVTQPRLFVYLSTVSVHGQVATSELDEETPLNKPGMYGLTKYMGELILREHAEQFPSVCVRLPGVVGPGNLTSWIGTVFEKAVRNDPISVYNPGSRFNNIVDLAELDRFLSRIIDIGFDGFDCFNLAAREPLTIRQVVQQIISLTNSESQVQEQMSDKQSFQINVDKIKHAFQFEPATTSRMVNRYVTESMPSLILPGQKR